NLPSSSVISTVLPGSALPVMVVLSTSPSSSKLFFTSSILGLSGGVVSPTIISGSEVLPSLSSAVTSYSSPSSSGGWTTAVKLPSPSTSASPTVLPPLSLITTLSPGVASPVTVVFGLPFSS